MYNKIREEKFLGARITRFGSMKMPETGFLGSDARTSFEFAEVLRSYLQNEGVPDILECQDFCGIGYSAKKMAFGAAVSRS